MNLIQKKKVIKAVKLGMNKIELIDYFSYIKNNELKELIKFYEKHIF